MVSTRSPRSRIFEKGERVLCYEPDPTKAKVLYDSKVLGTYETRDKRGRRLVQYKVHFQGWSSSWDRKVNANFLLKDTAENRQLQKDLAEKAQLQLGAYLYRRERSGSSKKKSQKLPKVPEESGSGNSLIGGVASGGFGGENSSPKLRNRVSSEDNYSSGSTFERNDADFVMRDDCETESYCSSIESNVQDEERVQLRISERLRLYLENDYEITVKEKRQHVLPARIPVVAILENFVKQTAFKLTFNTTQSETTLRRRSTLQRTDKKEREFDKLLRTVALLKEVADGLRIYFDFTVADYLLYKEEKDYALSFLSEDNLKNFTYIPATSLSPDFLSSKNDADHLTTESLEGILSTTNTSIITNQQSSTQCPAATGGNSTESLEEPQKRKLRSYRSDDCDVIFENCLSSIASTGSSGGSTPMHSNVTTSTSNYIKSLQSMALSMTPQTRKFLQKILNWRILPTNAAAAPSMIFGAPHLARLIVKLPEFLNASTMNDEKLKVLLQHLDTFTNYLESHKEWFTDENYFKNGEVKNEPGLLFNDVKNVLELEASNGLEKDNSKQSKAEKTAARENKTERALDIQC